LDFILIIWIDRLESKVRETTCHGVEHALDKSLSPLLLVLSFATQVWVYFAQNPDYSTIPRLWFTGYRLHYGGPLIHSYHHVVLFGNQLHRFRKLWLETIMSTILGLLFRHRNDSRRVLLHQ
jgi:hypothetical protein